MTIEDAHNLYEEVLAARHKGEISEDGFMTSCIGLANVFAELELWPDATRLVALCTAEYLSDILPGKVAGNLLLAAVVIQLAHRLNEAGLVPAEGELDETLVAMPAGKIMAS